MRRGERLQQQQRPCALALEAWRVLVPRSVWRTLVHPAKQLVSVIVN
jgi:hypothetical protein